MTTTSVIIAAIAATATIYPWYWLHRRRRNTLRAQAMQRHPAGRHRKHQ